jgi:hypothetical protein
VFLHMIAFYFSFIQRVSLLIMEDRFYKTLGR